MIFNVIVVSKVYFLLLILMMHIVE